MNPYSLVVITDLDGTLLDQETYQYESALPAIRELSRLQIPLVLCSSKTQSEIVPLWRELKGKDPFITENGGAIYFPLRYFPFQIPRAERKEAFEMIGLGTEIVLLRKCLTETARQCGVQVQPLSLAEPGFFARLTGLTLVQAELALRRQYDEPFLVKEGDPEQLFAVLTANGLTVSHGDRFFHLTENHDKGKAVRLLLDLYGKVNPEVKSIGLGNSGNDLSLLQAVDHPVLVRNPDGRWDSKIKEKLPKIRCTEEIGPKGWREAVEGVVKEINLPI